MMMASRSDRIAARAAAAICCCRCACVRLWRHGEPVDSA
jgi:hypothetical protein